MKKLFGWIWSKKQNEVEVFEVRPYRMIDEKVRDFNADHGLPLDQLVGYLMKLLNKLLNRKKPKQPEPFFEWVETSEEKQE